MTFDPAQRGPWVLVVDDERDMRDLARLSLEIGGLVVDEASNGTEALERFFEPSPPPLPSAVVLDIRMPGLNGFEVAERMLSRNPTQVIVLFSAQLDSASEDAARASGVRACVPKHDVMKLPEIIRHLLPAA